MNRKTLVINLFGVPGAGKSTGAAYIYAKLKMKGINAELVTEFAKEKAWEENYLAIENQAYVYGNQSYYMSRCRETVDVIVTDSPLPLGIIYNVRPSEEFNRLVINDFNSYDNINYLLVKAEDNYNPGGRFHTQKEAEEEIAPKLDKLLEEYKIGCTKLLGNEEGFDYIVEEITGYLDNTHSPHAEIFEKFDQKLNEEYKSFREGMLKENPEDIYDSSYRIFFYDEFYSMLSCDYAEKNFTDQEVSWLADQEKILDYLWEVWLNCDSTFDHNWDTMIEWIHTAVFAEV